MAAEADSMSDVSELLAALRRGDLTLDEVAAEFRSRAWRPTRTVARTTEEIASQRDPGGDVPGSYDEVTAAYDHGELTCEQYRVLSAAVAEAINADARREAE
jgi:predicted RNA-binding protein associated with RNAse of E/G family